MKLVLKYSVTDGCTYSNDIIYPFQYESKEKAEYDFLELAEKAFSDKVEFKFCSQTFDSSGFFYNDHKWKQDPKYGKMVYIPPIILPLEEWFDQYSIS